MLLCASLGAGVVPHAHAAEPEPVALRLLTDLDGGITSWLIAGGFKWGKRTREEAFAYDELQGAATADPRAGELLSSDETKKRKGKPRTWKLVVGRSAKFNLKRLVKPKRKAAAYAFARIEVPTARAGRLLIGSDDGVRVWLNGALIHEHRVKRKHVADSELVPIALVAGVNRLLLKIDQTSGGWAFSARIVDSTGVPMPDLRVVLRGAPDDEGDALLDEVFRRAARTRLAVKLRRGASTAQIRFRLAAAIHEAPQPLIVATSIQGRALRREVSVADAMREAVTLQAPFQPHKPLRARLTVRDARGRILFEQRLGRAFPKPLVSLAFAAERALGRADPSRVPQASIDSVGYTLQRGRALLEDGSRDRDYARKLLGAALKDAKALARGKDPYARKRQAFYRAYRSPYDDTLQHYAAYVPSGYRKKKKYPLVVALHGFKSTTMITLRRALGSSITELSYADGDRKVPRFSEERFLVAAPRGYGNIAYRYIAEDDILRVIEEMKRAYNVDEDRIYLTGLSMGGLGTMEVGLHFPDVFAGLISNCGAADTRLYESIEGYTPEPWEADLIEGRSAVLWAENGLHLPFFIAHGMKDPINEPRNSKVLVKEYERLGYRIDSRFDPELGHNVWDRTYEKGRIWTRFLKYRRDPKPLHVIFKSAHTRYTRSYWVRLREWARPWRFARVEGRVDPAANGVKVSTQNLLGFALALAETKLDLRRPVRVEVDGRVAHDGLVTAAQLTFARANEGEAWRVADAPAAPAANESASAASLRSVFQSPPVGEALRKRAGLSGPIEDFKYVRQLLVYGSDDPAEEPTLRRAALDAASYHSNSGIRLAVRRDTEVTDEDLRTSHLHLFGTPRSNRWLRKIEAQLPVRITADGALVNGALHAGGDVGFKLIYPNPLAPNRYVVVSAGVHAHAVLWANWLPLWVPDFIVYDQKTVSPRWGKILAGRKARAAGYFDRAWKVPTVMGASR